MNETNQKPNGTTTNPVDAAEQLRVAAQKAKRAAEKAYQAAVQAAKNAERGVVMARIGASAKALKLSEADLTVCMNSADRIAARVNVENPAGAVFLKSLFGVVES